MEENWPTSSASLQSGRSRSGPPTGNHLPSVLKPQQILQAQVVIIGASIPTTSSIRKDFRSSSGMRGFDSVMPRTTKTWPASSHSARTGGEAGNPAHRRPASRGSLGYAATNPTADDTYTHFADINLIIEADYRARKLRAEYHGGDRLLNQSLQAPRKNTRDEKSAKWSSAIHEA